MSYFGSSTFDTIHGIAAGPTGSVVVTGATCGTFPTTSGVFQPAIGGDRDNFVARVDTDKGRVDYASYLGGPGDESGGDQKVALLPDGRAAVVTVSNHDGFPVTVDAGRSAAAGPDLTLSVISRDGSRLDYSSCAGGTDEEDLWAAKPAAGDDDVVYVSGVTWSTDVPRTTDAVQPEPGGAADVLILGFDVSRH